MSIDTPRDDTARNGQLPPGELGDDDTAAAAADFSAAVGRRLRAVRKAKAMSLDEVESSSGGRWSASAVGAYERGFRTLSLPRLHELAAFYRVPIGALLGEDAEVERLGRAARVVVDLEVLAGVEEGAPALRYLRGIMAERGDWNGRILSIRRDDVRALAAICHTDENGLLELLGRWNAIREERS